MDTRLSVRREGGLPVVLSTFNQGDVVLAKSLLIGEGIAYATLGEAFNWVRPWVVPVRFVVPEDQIDTASEVLKDLDLAYGTFSMRGASPVAEVAGLLTVWCFVPLGPILVLAYFLTRRRSRDSRGDDNLDV